MLFLAALLACVPAREPDPDARAGLVYEVYVRSFQDSDGDGIGDLEGLQTRLPYIASLGTETLWLMPVFPAVGPVGYDVTDYEQVRADYGDEEGLADVVSEAHALGMEVLLDLPLNHTSSAHPRFLAAEAGDAEQRDRYVFSSTRGDPSRWFPAPDGRYYYGYFGPELPDVDWRNADAREERLEVFDRWLTVVDGYRLDAVVTYVENDDQLLDTEATHAILADLHERADSATLLAEASLDAVDGNLSYLGDAHSEEADLVLDFPRHDALLETFLTGDARPLRRVLDEQGDLALLAAPFLGSHDVARLAERLPSAKGRRAAFVAHVLLPGRPVVYYGDEIDLPEADDTCLGQDYCMRAPMPWSDGHAGGFTTGTPWFTPHGSFEVGVNVHAEGADADSLLTLVRTLGALRSQSEAVRTGDLDWSGRHRRLLAFERCAGDDLVRVRVNVSDAPVDDLGPWGYEVVWNDRIVVAS